MYCGVVGGCGSRREALQGAVALQTCCCSQSVAARTCLLPSVPLACQPCGTQRGHMRPHGVLKPWEDVQRAAGAVEGQRQADSHPLHGRGGERAFTMWSWYGSSCHTLHCEAAHVALTWPKLWPHLHGLQRRQGSIIRAQARQHCGLERKDVMELHSTTGEVCQACSIVPSANSLAQTTEVHPHTSLPASACTAQSVSARRAWASRSPANAGWCSTRNES